MMLVGAFWDRRLVGRVLILSIRQQRVGNMERMRKTERERESKSVKGKLEAADFSVDSGAELS